MIGDGGRRRDSIPIAAILRDTYRVPLSPLSGTSPPWQISVNECFALISTLENALGGFTPTSRLARIGTLPYAISIHAQGCDDYP